ncbi:MAG: hypothetical protein Q9211_000080 [Gyalolechia sp. 1 TL-2023]
MPTSRIRGGTPYSYHKEQHSVGDPKLTALLEELGQHNQSWASQHLLAAAEAARATYQPPPDIYTPDRECSPPAAGLLSPAASLPDPYLQHDTTYPPHPAASDGTPIQPAILKVGDSEYVSALVEPVADASRLQQHHSLQKPFTRTSTDIHPTAPQSCHSTLSTIILPTTKIN